MEQHSLILSNEAKNALLKVMDVFEYGNFLMTLADVRSKMGEVKSDNPTIKCARLTETAKIPIKGTEGAACYDLFADEIEKISEDLYLVRFNVVFDFPKDLSLDLIPRSSLSKTGFILANCYGIGDSDYKQGYMAYYRAFPNGVEKVCYTTNMPHIIKETFKLTYPPFPYKVGERCLQARFMPVNGIIEEIELVEFNTETKRQGGFGSTGK